MKYCIKCAKNNIQTSASFNIEGMPPIYCKKCSMLFPDMVDVKHKKCLEKNCNKNPYFNYPEKNEKIKGIYCSDHAKEGMINVKSILCELCTTQASFGIENNKPLRCSVHAEGMINVLKKKCKECDLLPSFNYVDENTPIYCSKHKKEGMIDKKYKKCKMKDCKNTAYYNEVEKNKPEYCYIHKTSTMINYCSKY